ncbi:MAG: Glycerol-3-phosphate dehydrogenase [NAD(P)+] [Holosporales bacterium]
MSDIVVVGAGAYGTALAIHWRSFKKSVTLITKTKNQASDILKTNKNEKYLSGISLNGLAVTHCLESLRQAKIIVLAIPSQLYKNYLIKIKDLICKDAYIVIASKGIDVTHVCFLSDLVKAHFKNSFAIWSGPQFALEVASLLPSAVTLASSDEKALTYLTKTLSTERLKVYPTNDVLSVELSGALKNVIAIACGMARGKKLGENAIAALMTRGLSEIRRLGIKMGGSLETFLGLSCMGDLVLTCSSTTSRNTQFGMKVANTQNLKSLMESDHPLAEGIFTAKAAMALSNKYRVYMPITRSVYRVLYEDAALDDVVLELLSTKTHSENE